MHRRAGEMDLKSDNFARQDSITDQTNMRKLFLYIYLAVFSVAAMAQAPAGYYTDTSGLTGYALKTRLHQVIKAGHSDQGYPSLYDGYKTTDKDIYYENDGTLLDMYSERPNAPELYTYSLTNAGDRCGQYSAEGHCFNREHTIPQSLFNEASPMKNDIHFVIPTDGWVNGQRGNIPYGKVNSPNWTSSNGSKRGPNASSGFNGIVFEPIDEFKGDLARIVFYFATRYQDRIPDFSQGNILDGTTTRSLQQWQAELLLQWHQQDPVSDKEIDRNNAAFAYQGNRNPFVDHPRWVDCIWGNANCNTAIDTGTDTGSTSLSDLSLQQLIGIYPNPAFTDIQINSDASNKIIAVTIISVDGRTLLSNVNNARSTSLSVNITGLDAGIYFVNIITDKGIVVKKLVKQ